MAQNLSQESKLKLNESMYDQFKLMMQSSDEDQTLALQILDNIDESDWLSSQYREQLYQMFHPMSHLYNEKARDIWMKRVGPFKLITKKGIKKFCP